MQFTSALAYIAWIDKHVDVGIQFQNSLMLQNVKSCQHDISVVIINSFKLSTHTVMTTNKLGHPSVYQVVYSIFL